MVCRARPWLLWWCVLGCWTEVFGAAFRFGLVTRTASLSGAGAYGAAAGVDGDWKYGPSWDPERGVQVSVRLVRIPLVFISPFWSV